MQNYHAARLRYVMRQQASPLASAVALALFLASVALWASIVGTFVGV